MAKAKKLMGVQQILLFPDVETQALLEYLCQQSGKLDNSGLYFARQLFFKTGKLITGKFDLAYESSNNFGFWIRNSYIKNLKRSQAPQIYLWHKSKINNLKFLTQAPT